MKKLLLNSLLLLIAITTFAQENYTQEEGKVTQHEVSMTKYENDKDAEAVVIYDLGDYRFSTDYQRGFILNMKRRTKIKVLKQAGEKYATFEIPYYTGDHDWEDIYDIKGTTYNWDGKSLTKTELDMKSIFEEKINENVRVKKIALSNVKEGSIIEFSYTIATPYFVNMREWQFQRKIPVIYSQLDYTAIPYYEYSYILKGATKFDKINSVVKNDDIRFGSLVYREMIWTFGMNNLPAFRDEEFISSEKDYMVSMIFQISTIHNPRGGKQSYISTWPELATDFHKDSDFGGYIKSSEKEGKKILPTLELDGKSQLEQAKIITRHVKSMYNWNGFYGRYSSGKVSNFLKQKTGNVADLNLYLVGLLRAAGLDANAVLISTRENGSISKLHPFRSFFNYVIAEVTIDNVKYDLDATVSLLHFDELPKRSVHVHGLVIKPKTEEWIITEQKNPAITEKEFTVKINPEESKTEVNATYNASGYDAYTYRAAYLGKVDKLKTYIKDETQYDTKGDIQIKETKDFSEPFTFTFAFEGQIESASDKLFIHPFCNLSISENPFKQTQRTLPVDLIYFRGQKYKSVIEIPEGYIVDFLPKSTNHDSSIFTFNYSAKEADGRIEVVADFAYKKNIYPAQEYARLKATLSAIIKQLSEMVVLKKKDSQNT